MKRVSSTGTRFSLDTADHPWVTGINILVRDSRFEDGTFKVDIRINLWHSLSWHPSQRLQPRRVGLSAGTNLWRSPPEKTIG